MSAVCSLGDLAFAVCDQNSRQQHDCNNFVHDRNRQKKKTNTGQPGAYTHEALDCPVHALKTDLRGTRVCFGSVSHNIFGFYPGIDLPT